MKRVFLTIAVMAASIGVAPAVMADTISNGGYVAGIGPNGELFDDEAFVGLQNPDGDDYIRPGTPRDSWGVSGSTGSAFADYKNYGTLGIIGTTNAVSASAATYVTETAMGLTLTQFYTFFAPNILSIQETLTNTSGAAIDNVVFRRNVDLDIPPTLYNENVFGVLGSNSAVIGNSYYGFEYPDPTYAFGRQCGSSCNQTGDLGAGIDLGLGTIAAGGSTTFAYYYGINAPGQTLDQLFAQAQGLGLNYLIGAQSLESGTYPNLGARSGFLGVSAIGTVAGSVPEPATWAMMIIGVGFIGAAARRSRVAIRPALAA